MDERILILFPRPADAVEKLLNELADRHAALCAQIRRDLGEVKLASLRVTTRDALAALCAGQADASPETLNLARQLSTALFGGVIRPR